MNTVCHIKKAASMKSKSYTGKESSIVHATSNFQYVGMIETYVYHVNLPHICLAKSYI